MSKIIRSSTVARKVYIGEKHLDFETEETATRRLGELVPLATVMTDADGAKWISIQEVPKIETYIVDEREKSFQEGFEQGKRQGLNEGLVKAEQVLKQFNGAIQDAIGQRQELLDESRQQVLKLALQIAKKITFDAIEFDPDKTLGMIDGVINTLVDKSRLKIKVHPDHLPIVEQNIDRFLKGSTAIKELEIVGDPRVKYGGCFIETPNGDVDARLESQFDVIEEAINAEGDDQ